MLNTFNIVCLDTYHVFLGNEGQFISLPLTFHLAGRLSVFSSSTVTANLINRMDVKLNC